MAIVQNVQGVDRRLQVSLPKRDISHQNEQSSEMFPTHISNLGENENKKWRVGLESAKKKSSANKLAKSHDQSPSQTFNQLLNLHAIFL